MDISKHPLLKQAYEVCQAIERCGASVELSAAVTKASDLMFAIDVDLNAQKAKIDRLMLEYCPDEMTEDQKENWAKHQRPVTPNLKVDTLNF